MSIFLDLHALQPIPFANLNRDEMGSPKTVHYGGKDRSRVSSQAWKHVIRQHVEHTMGQYAGRTRMVPGKVAETLADRGWPADLAGFAGLQAIRSDAKDGVKPHASDPSRSAVLLFLPEGAVGELAALCERFRAQLEVGFAARTAKAAGKASRSATKDDPILPVDEVRKILVSRAASIDLFGRMLAEIPGGKIDGAVHVAHAFTTHASDPQPDFFTAVDDWQTEQETGSGHMQTQDFSAGVFYRYASVNVDDLIRNLGGESERARAREIVTWFADAFVYSLPQAKRTSTAAHTIPELAYFAVHDGRPLSLAGAFEAPVPARGDGYLKPSVERLAEHAAGLHRLTNSRGLVDHAHAGVPDKPHDGLGERVDGFDDLIRRTVARAFDARPGA